MSEPPSRDSGQRSARMLRLVVLLVILAISTVIGILHQIMPFGKAPVGVDALCPFGAIESAFTLIASGAMLQRIAVSSFILLAAVIITALIFRRAFCGYICPLGTLQELFSRLGRRLLKKSYRLPAAVDRPARYIKYLVLVVVVVGSARTADLIIRPYDPWAAYHHLTSNEVWTEFPWGLSILAVTLIGSLFFNRVFCKYLCPMGAFLGLISPLGATKPHRDPKTCISCHRCDRICPVDIDVSKQTTVKSAECLDCHECVNVCPVADTLFLENRRSKRVAPKTALVAVAAIFLGTVGITSAARVFQWTTVPIGAEMAKSGSFDPAAIRGKMIFADVVAASGVPEEVVAGEFKLTPEDLRAPIKDAGMKYGFETEDVRDFLAEYLAKESASAQSEAPAATETPAFDPQTIVGTMSLEEAAKVAGIPPAALADHFSVSESDRSVPLKDLKGRYPFDTQAVRDYVDSVLRGQ